MEQRSRQGSSAAAQAPCDCTPRARLTRSRVQAQAAAEAASEEANAKRKREAEAALEAETERKRIHMLETTTDIEFLRAEVLKARLYCIAWPLLKALKRASCPSFDASLHRAEPDTIQTLSASNASLTADVASAQAALAKASAAQASRVANASFDASRAGDSIARTLKAQLVYRQRQPARRGGQPVGAGVGGALRRPQQNLHRRCAAVRCVRLLLGSMRAACTIRSTRFDFSVCVLCASPAATFSTIELAKCLRYGAVLVPAWPVRHLMLDCAAAHAPSGSASHSPAVVLARTQLRVSYSVGTLKVTGKYVMMK